jgi:hypothetical protein
MDSDTRQGKPSAGVRKRHGFGHEVKEISDWSPKEAWIRTRGKENQRLESERGMDSDTRQGKPSAGVRKRHGFGHEVKKISDWSPKEAWIQTRGKGNQRLESE